MEKIQNCPNNPFDCGMMCGISVGYQSILEILEKEKNMEKAMTVFGEFIRALHEDISKNHLEHINEKYRWEEILEKVLKNHS